MSIGAPVHRVHRVIRFCRCQSRLGAESVLAVGLPGLTREAGRSVLVLEASPWLGGRGMGVPQGADVSHVPAGITILTMASHGFTWGKLTWLTNKKNAMRYPPKDRSPASVPVKQE